MVLRAAKILGCQRLYTLLEGLILIAVFICELGDGHAQPKQTAILLLVPLTLPMNFFLLRCYYRFPV